MTRPFLAKRAGCSKVVKVRLGYVPIGQHGSSLVSKLFRRDDDALSINEGQVEDAWGEYEPSPSPTSSWPDYPMCMWHSSAGIHRHRCSSCYCKTRSGWRLGRVPTISTQPYSLCSSFASERCVSLPE